MLHQLHTDQEFFRDTTSRFLDELAPVGVLRQLRDHDAGYDPDYWRRGAELGWTSLLVDEAHGGGSISGSGLVDLTLVAHEFGRHAAPGPLAATNVVAAMLSRHGGGAHAEAIAGLLAGTTVAGWGVAKPGALEVRVEGGDVVLNGSARPVESAQSASVLLVAGRSGDGVTHVLVPTDAPGVRISPMRTVDLTRRFAAVTFDGVRLPAGAVVGEPGAAGAAVHEALLLALVIAAAESVGAMQAAFDMTVEWGFDRYSFGRPLASYQALKHRYADMKSWLEGAHAIADEAAAAVASGSGRAALKAHAAAAFIGDYGSELAQDCVQLHGGIGVTFEHDLHLYLRRIVVNRSIHGTPAEHRQRITDIVVDEEHAA